MRSAVLPTAILVDAHTSAITSTACCGASTPRYSLKFSHIGSTTAGGRHG